MWIESFYRKNKRWLLWSSIALLSAYQFKTGIIAGWQMQSDFPNYYTSSCLLIEHQDLSKLYDNAWFQQQIFSHGINTAGKFSPFPPPTVLVFVPFTPFDPPAAKRIWLLCNLLLVVPLLGLMKRVTGFSIPENLLLLLLCGLGLATNLLLGQMYLLLLFALFTGYDLIQRKKDFAAGIIWGVAAAIKYVPVVFLVPYLLMKNKKIPLGFFVGFTGIHLFSFFLMGNQVYCDYLNVLLNHAGGSIEGQNDFAYQFQSWNVILRRLFVFDAQQNPNPVMNSSLLFQLSRILIYAIVILIAAKIIYESRKTKSLAELSFAVIGISAFEILPASATYHFILLVFPLAFILRILNSENLSLYKAMLIISFAAIGLPPIILQRIIPETSPFIFYRLCFMTCLYVVTIWVVVKKIHTVRR